MKKIITFIAKWFTGKGVGEETLRYLIAGGLTTLVNFCLFALMTKVLGIGVNVSNVVSISASIIFAYVINKLFVFKRRRDTRLELALEFAKFVGARLFTMALEIGVVALFFDVLKQDELIGKAVSQVLVVISNYIISKAIVFRKGRS